MDTTSSDEIGIFEFVRYSSGIGRLRAITTKGFDYLFAPHRTVNLTDGLTDLSSSIPQGLINQIVLDGTALTGNLSLANCGNVDTEEGVYGPVVSIALIGGAYNVTLPAYAAFGNGAITLSPGQVVYLIKGAIMVGTGVIPN